VLHCYLDKGETTARGTGEYQKGMYKEIKGQDQVVYVELLHSIGRKGREQVVYTISKKSKARIFIIALSNNKFPTVIHSTEIHLV
jgi:hypothetical protein